MHMHLNFRLLNTIMYTQKTNPINKQCKQTFKSHYKIYRDKSAFKCTSNYGIVLMLCDVLQVLMYEKKIEKSCIVKHVHQLF